MLVAVNNPIIIEKISNLEGLLPDFSKQNVQRGERLNNQLSLASLFKFISDEMLFEGLFCNGYDFHVHYQIHLDYKKPMMEVIAGDPSVAYDLIESEIGLLLPKALEKKYANDRKKRLLAEGKKVSGGGKGKKGIYIQTGNGFSKTPQENFKELVDIGRVSKYFVDITPELDFTAIRHPSRAKLRLLEKEKVQISVG